MASPQLRRVIGYPARSNLKAAGETPALLSRDSIDAGHGVAARQNWPGWYQILCMLQKSF
jgi:hypothetical protein